MGPVFSARQILAACDDPVDTISTADNKETVEYERFDPEYWDGSQWCSIEHAAYWALRQQRPNDEIVATDSLGLCQRRYYGTRKEIQNAAINHIGEELNDDQIFKP